MIRLISAVPISILLPPSAAFVPSSGRGELRSKPSVPALNALLHFFQLGAHAAIVDSAFQLDPHPPDEPWICLFVQDHFLAGDALERYTHPLHHIQIGRAHV